ncbi:hypothetical protein PTSG_11751 [Salpingoeca rosetta]|uniref:Uncharacterized protein n=1 Tax=Salpingoeca rosetta (strain ATCC 50818 / BSB-021) TaxID=946362 RepID=F2U0N6_SALR5|nr:uncharacterized protein PTSG_11751 [Salpingoeca rosetta]EGD80964.1 hypothetical protein PTSG_11751 [Salpingoeca rosetta]|eukprot:XP_004997525.1 hypothetical protein PTSG_11751 [Salpingoeca rosetta]
MERQSKSTSNGGGVGGGLRKVWRFPVRTAGVAATEDAHWTLTSDMQHSFHTVVESLSPLMDRCKKRCETTKRAGRVDAFQIMAARVLSLADHVRVTFSLVSAMARELLEMEEQAACTDPGERPYPHPPATPRTALRAHDPDAAARRRQNLGWHYVDDMHYDQGMMKARMSLAELNRMRAKEIRLAYVCGFRDALKQLLEWTRKHTHDTGVVSAKTLYAHLVEAATTENAAHEDDMDLSALSSKLTEASKLDPGMGLLGTLTMDTCGDSALLPAHPPARAIQPDLTAQRKGTFANFLRRRRQAAQDGNSTRHAHPRVLQDSVPRKHGAPTTSNTPTAASPVGKATLSQTASNDRKQNTRSPAHHNNTTTTLASMQHQLQQQQSVQMPGDASSRVGAGRDRLKLKREPKGDWSSDDDDEEDSENAPKQWSGDVMRGGDQESLVRVAHKQRKMRVPNKHT